MAKRPLDETERPLTEKGLARVEKEFADLQGQIDFNKRTIEFQKIQSEYQESTRPYLKKKKELDDKKVMGVLDEKLENLKFTRDNLKDQLDNGVTIKLNKEEVK